MNKKFLWLGSGLALTSLGAYAQKSHDVKPNIIYIMCDDMGYGDLGCYGQSYISTPNIDNMAKEGMRKGIQKQLILLINSAIYELYFRQQRT